MKMYKKIIDIIVEEMANSEGLDEIKSALRIALKVSGIEVNAKDWDYLMTEILYELGERRLR